jgi:hypothetical protein
MKKITLKVPDSKLKFFLELVKQLGLELENASLLIPEEHKSTVRERLKNAKEDDFTPWEEAREKLTFKVK